MEYDLIIVGGGPAGLSAANTAIYYKLNVLVIESAQAGGALVSQYPWKKVDNYLGVYGKNGMEAASLMVEHTKFEGVQLKENEQVTDVKRQKDYLKVKTNKGEYFAKSVILAIGLGSPRKLQVEGEELEGVNYCIPNPEIYKGKRIIVVGGGDTAVECAVELKRNGAEVTIVHRRDKFRATEKNIACVGDECVNVLYNTEVKRLIGDGDVEKALLYNNKEGSESEWAVEAVLFSLGTVANTDFLDKIGVKLDERKNVIVDSEMRTNIEGVFAAGDIVGKWIRIPQAIGEGALAGLNAFKYVKNPYWS